MFVSYMFFWYNLAAWLQGKPMLKYGKIFNLLAITGIMISFARGFYLSFSLATFLLLFILFLQRTVLLKRMLLSLLLVVYFILFASVSDYFWPVIERTASIKTAILTEIDRSTFGYRLKILESRCEMTMDRNPLLGIGFVHNKYGGDFGKFPGNYNEATGSPSLWSADIAWANIIYQTGLIGLASFLLFVFCLLWKYPRVIPGQKNFTNLLELAVYVELARNILNMFISASFTSNTQNIALLLTFLVYKLYSQQRQGRRTNEAHAYVGDLR